MGSVEEKIKTGALVSGGAQTNLLEEMKLLKEIQDHSGSLNFAIKNFFICFFLVSCSKSMATCCSTKMK